MTMNSKRTISIGRGSGCDIILSDDSISRIHAEMWVHNGQYVYYDRSSNGSSLNGQIISNRKIVVTPGTPILLANKIPLPWDKIYSLIPMSGYRLNEAQTSYSQNYRPESGDRVDFPQRVPKDELSVGLGILAFIVPLCGLIMYFIWKDETPNRAKVAGIIGTISFILLITGVWTI